MVIDQPAKLHCDKLTIVPVLAFLVNPMAQNICPGHA